MVWGSVSSELWNKQATNYKPPASLHSSDMFPTRTMLLFMPRKSLYTAAGRDHTDPQGNKEFIPLPNGEWPPHPLFVILA
jgi:hypothetical protein